VHDLISTHSATVAAGKFVVATNTNVINWSTMTVPYTCAAGDLFYATNNNVVGPLAVNITDTKKYLQSVSYGISYEQVSLTAGVTGILPSANGGTGVNNAGTLTNATATTITGGGTLALGGFVLTCPATGTVALLGQANVFTATPQDITAEGVNNTIRVLTYGSASYGAGFACYKAEGTLASPTKVLADEQLGVFGFWGYGATGFSAPSVAAMKMFAATDFTDTSMPTYATIATTPSASIVKSERIRICSTGSVLIGTTTDGMTAAGSLAIAKDLAHRGTLAGFFNAAPVAQHSHVTDATAGTVVAVVNDILLYMEQLGYIASA
jgi:hypothetical protein